MNKKALYFIGIFFCLCQIALGQPLWQNEAVLRKQFTLDLNNSVAHTSNGETLILWEKGYYGNQGLYLHKINVNGDPVWPEDICITNTGFQNWWSQIIPDNNGNFFIKWEENNAGDDNLMSIAKVNSDGQFIWQPQIIHASTGGYFAEIELDHNGGLFIVYSRNSGTQSSNIFLQHLSSTGVLLLPGDGIQLSNDTRQEDVDFIRVASGNELIVCYHIHTSTGQTNMLTRVTSDYQIAWANPLDVYQNSGYDSINDITAVDSTHFIVTWTEVNGSNSYAFMQKFNISGAYLFNPPIQFANNSGSTSLYTTLVNDNNGNLFIGIHKGSNMNPMSNSFRKYDYNGNSLWATSVVLSDSITFIYDSIPDNSGGCYVMHRSIRDNYSSYYDFRFQHIDATGQLLHPNGGYLIESDVPSSYQYSMTYDFTDRFYFYYVRNNLDKIGLYFQIRDMDGQLISLPRITIAEGINGNASIKGIVSRTSDILAYWMDDRFYSSTQNWSQLYYQTILPDGTMGLPENGILLCDNMAGYSNLQSLYLPNGNTVFLWTKVLNGSSYVMGKALDSADNVLWESDGRVFATFTDVSTISNLIVSNENNDIYLTWQSGLGNNQNRTYVQKIIDGQAIWGNQGLLVDTNHSGALLNEMPAYFKERYLVIKGRLDSSDSYVWVAHIEPDGTFSAGWQPNGITAINWDYVYGYTLLADAVCINENLFLFYEYQTVGNLHYAYSVFQPDGTTLITLQPLLNDAYGEVNLKFDLINGIVYTLKLISPTGYSNRFGYNKLSDLTSHPWGDNAQYVYSSGNSSSFTPFIRGFSNGGYLINWLKDYTIYASYIDAQGTNLSPMNGSELINNSYDVFFTAALGNDIYIAWNDYKVTSVSSGKREIRMQKIGNYTIVGNDDNCEVPVDKNLSCYPNPFSGNITIEVFTENKGKNEIAIYNIKGQKVTTITNSILDKGKHSFIWNGTNSIGNHVSKGIYYIRFENEYKDNLAKIIYLK